MFDLERYHQALRDGSPDWVAWAVATPWAYFLGLGCVSGVIVFGASLLGWV